jgi:hypothetical protein
MVIVVATFLRMLAPEARAKKRIKSVAAVEYITSGSLAAPI